MATTDSPDGIRPKPKPKPAPARDSDDVHIIAGLRNRMDSLAAQALSHIEAEGLYVNGEAHPLIPALGILLSAGTAHRQLAIDRRAFAIDYGTAERKK